MSASTSKPLNGHKMNTSICSRETSHVLHLEVVLLWFNFAICWSAWAFGSRVQIHDWCRHQSQLDGKTQNQFPASTLRNRDYSRA